MLKEQKRICEVVQLLEKSNEFKNAANKTMVTPFETFENRIYKLLQELSKQGIGVNLNQEQLKKLYNKVLPVIETSIFAEMEQMMNTIQNSLQIVSKMGGKSSLDSFMDNEDDFKRFLTHVATSFQSIQEQRIDILMTHNPAYQGIEDDLFGEKFITENDFDRSFEIHLEMIEAFHDCYHELLFEGVLLDKDDQIETNVIEAVIQRYEKDIQAGGSVE